MSISVKLAILLFIAIETNFAIPFKDSDGNVYATFLFDADEDLEGNLYIASWNGVQITKDKGESFQKFNELNGLRTPGVLLLTVTKSNSIIAATAQVGESMYASSKYPPAINRMDSSRKRFYSEPLESEVTTYDEDGTVMVDKGYAASPTIIVSY